MSWYICDSIMPPPHLEVCVPYVDRGDIPRVAIATWDGFDWRSEDPDIADSRCAILAWQRMPEPYKP
jgi:hypothetical protein